jgi:hypothetical protein
MLRNKEESRKIDRPFKPWFPTTKNTKKLHRAHHKQLARDSGVDVKRSPAWKRRVTKKASKVARPAKKHGSSDNAKAQEMAKLIS